MSNLVVEEREDGTLAEFNKLNAIVEAMRGEIDGRVYQDNPQGVAMARTDRSRIVKFRTKVEAVRTAEKAPHIKAGREIDKAAKKLAETCRELEEAPNRFIKADEKRIADAKAEKERIELARIQDIQDRIKGMDYLLSEHHPVDDLAARLAELEAVDIDDSFEEFQEQALAKKAGSVIKCAYDLEVASRREQDAITAKAEAAANEAALAEATAQLKDREPEKSTQEPERPTTPDLFADMSPDQQQERVLECSKFRSQNEALKYILRLITDQGGDSLSEIKAVCRANITSEPLITEDDS